MAFDAQVVEQANYKEFPALVLDRTCFYPEGGGQPADNGTLNGVRVIDVQTRESDKAVLHVLERELKDQRVEGQIDAARRLDFMQHHSGQHVLSKALEVAAKADTLSVHMSADSMTIDVNRPTIAPDEWPAVEDLANRIVQENRLVRAWFPAPDELASLAIRKLPDLTGSVRIVDMGGFDLTACGGTHVARTGEIGLIKVVKAERRGNTTRLEFKCGSRSLRDYREKNDVISRLTASLTVGYWELNEAVARLQTENKALRSDLKMARDRLADAEAMVMLSSAPLYSDRRIVARAFEGRDVEDVRMLAQKLIAQPATVALLGIAGEKAQLIFGRADDLPLDMVPVLKQAMAALGAERGGGRPNLAQGGGIPATLAQIKAAIHQAEERVK
jgi:alanyl-tRNA synthetase